MPQIVPNLTLPVTEHLGVTHDPPLCPIMFALAGCGVALCCWQGEVNRDAKTLTVWAMQKARKG